MIEFEHWIEAEFWCARNASGDCGIKATNDCNEYTFNFRGPFRGYMTQAVTPYHRR